MCTHLYVPTHIILGLYTVVKWNRNSLEQANLLLRLGKTRICLCRRSRVSCPAVTTLPRLSPARTDGWKEARARGPV